MATGALPEAATPSVHDHALSRLDAAVEGLHRQLDALGSEPGPAVLADPEAVARTVAEVERLCRRASSLKLRVVACANRSNAARRAGFASTGAWLARQTRASGVEGARVADLAEALDGDLEQTARALSAGELSAEHAAVIAWAARGLPDGLDPQERRAVETSLVQQARRLDPGRLKRAARRAIAVIEEDERLVDAHEDAMVRNEEAAALRRTWLTLHDNGDGTMTGRFTVPTLAGHVLRKAVQQLVSPRRDRRGAEDVEAGRWPADIDWPHRHGMAFVQLLEHLPTDRLHGKVAATVVVRLDRDQLLGDLRSAGVDTGHQISASEARRLACGSGVLPAVFAGSALPLDLGRSTRFFTEAQRTALATAYDECAAAGCDRPFAWTELHHEQPWQHGGTTDLANALPLCGFHHRLIHSGTHAARLSRRDGVTTVRFHPRR